MKMRPVFSAACSASRSGRPADVRPRGVASAHNSAIRRKGELQPVPAVLNYHMKSLDGKDVDLSKYLGKVVLMVNVASRCGQHAPVQAARRDV